MTRTGHFKGQVLPTEAKCTVPNVHTFQWLWQERNMSLEFKVEIRDGKIDVKISAPEYRDADLPEWHRRAFDVCRSIISLHAFKMGLGLTVTLDAFITPTGREGVWLVGDNRLPAVCTAITTDEEFDQVWHLVLADPTLIRHLSDLIESITIPHAAVINCARVVDGIKALVSPDENNEKRAWKRLQDAFNIEESYLQLLSETSRKPRHGRHVRIGGILVNEVVLRAWNVMNRYLEYRKRGNMRLPLSEFPLLKQAKPDPTP
jgi:hypothetical protein